MEMLFSIKDLTSLSQHWIGTNKQGGAAAIQFFLPYELSAKERFIGPLTSINEIYLVLSLLSLSSNSNS